jgi:HSP20 family molecular chaperone IbpA
MNKPMLKRTLIAVGVLAVIGTVGAQAYYSHELAERVAAQKSIIQSGTTIVPGGEWSDPWTAMRTEMMRMQEQMDQMYNATFRDFHPTGGAGQKANVQVTLEEQGNDYVVKANIPGAKESDIDVNLDGRLLSISSQSQGREKQTGDNGQVIRHESYASSFQQAFTLPGPVNATGMQSHFKDGVLTVTIPKATS